MNNFKRIFLLSLVLLLGLSRSFTQPSKADWADDDPEGCTSITLGKKATTDGSVVTSHTDDSHRTNSDIQIVPARSHKPGSILPMYKRENRDDLPMPAYKHTLVGHIPQIPSTFAYINSPYPCMNEHQLGIGESTFGGRNILQSDNGLIDCQRLCRLMLERSRTAREAIIMAGELLKEYGWNDYGECLTIADKNEVWHLEIVGPGKGLKGAIWAAQRVPDDHVSVNANASTIKEINIDDPDYFMASDNVFQVAQDSGWWNPKQGPFKFCYAYAPESRNSLAARRREWRVFDLVAPSLKLHPEDKDYPFSVKPDSLVTMTQLVAIFKDYYEDTPFDMRKYLTVADDDGKVIISPLANPQMPYDANKLFKTYGGWGWRGERTIARWYTMYATIIQCRNWLPDEIGGVVWLAMDNVASSIYIPVYCQNTDLPAPYKIDGRETGYSKDCAWWAFNRLGTLSCQRWGDMRHDLDAVWVPWQNELFAKQIEIEKQALAISNKKKRIAFLTAYTNEWGNKVIDKAWELGDLLWTKYDGKF